MLKHDLLCQLLPQFVYRKRKKNLPKCFKLFFRFDEREQFSKASLFPNKLGSKRWFIREFVNKLKGSNSWGISSKIENEWVLWLLEAGHKLLSLTEKYSLKNHLSFPDFPSWHNLSRVVRAAISISLTSLELPGPPLVFLTPNSLAIFCPSSPVLSSTQLSWPLHPLGNILFFWILNHPIHLYSSSLFIPLVSWVFSFSTAQLLNLGIS